MKLHDWNAMAEEPLNPHISRRAIHAASLTIARLSLARGAVVPTHQHVNEQVSLIESGRLLFHIGGQEIEVAAGQALEIPSNVPHSVEALEDSVAIDVFSPVREDWKRGDDAYLRTPAAVSKPSGTNTNRES